MNPPDINNPERTKIYYYRARTKMNLGKYKEAIEDFDKYIEIHPQFAEAYYNRGVAKTELDRIEEAILDFYKAIEINPLFLQVFYEFILSTHPILLETIEANPNCLKSLM